MKARIKNLFVVPALIAGLVLIPAGRVTAQTFTTLHSFTASSNSPPYGNSDGAYPVAGLILSGNTLYGTAQNGGRSDNGTVFAVNTDGTRFTNLHGFNGSDGAGPRAGLWVTVHVFVLSFMFSLGGTFTLRAARLSLAHRILIPPPTYAARRKGTQRLRCSMGRCSRRGSLKAAFRWWYQDAPVLKSNPYSTTR